ncbi:divergent polysaccharide deacteylase family protein [Thalassovita sp.]|uniref:divergent polysaccharide deacteylase family protein n=1 Tax=Thalassovita sp. TaxID=1979401 RepID=UPI0029DE7EFA|nr:divergent polysaccharide deacetylase family protein [Thalassovita sp.]
MAKGVFRGFLTGVVIAGFGAAMVSVLGTLPQAPVPEATTVEVPPGSDFQGKRDDEQPSLPAADPTPDPAPTPRMDVPESEGGSPVADDITQPADRPETGQPDTPLTPPADVASPAGAGGQPDTAPAPAPNPANDLQQPSVPDSEGDAAISTDPAQPTIPAAPEEKAFPEEKPADPVDMTPAAEEGAPPVPPKRSDPLPSVTDSTDGDNRPRIGTPAGNLTDKDDAPDAPPVPEVKLRPIETYAAPFDNPDAKPLMSVILLDQGNSSIGLEALTAFPYPLSFAVDPLSPGAAERMDSYRAAGFEVLAMVDMPQGATAADTETLLRAALSRMPGAVAVIEGEATGLQTDKQVSDQAAAILAETGHGLVLFPKGLNTAQKLAAKAGVPAATVFRDFDGNDQNAAIIRRFLDQAAFKARQEENGVIMLGRLRPETISALLLWGLQDRAESVALAPISALLLATQN